MSYYIDSCPLYWGLTEDPNGACFGPFKSSDEAWKFLEQYQDLIETEPQDRLPPPIKAKMLEQAIN